MSIRMDKEKCTACGKCREVCPGSLIDADERGKAFIKYPRDCWGCAACLKECRSGAIHYYLGADIGGKGTVMQVRQRGDILEWKFTREREEIRTFRLHRKESNKY